MPTPHSSWVSGFTPLHVGVCPPRTVEQHRPEHRSVHLDLLNQVLQSWRTGLGLQLWDLDRPFHDVDLSTGTTVTSTILSRTKPVESRSSSELSELGFASASRSGTALVASVLCCTTGIRHFVAELKLRHLDRCSAHLDCGTCLCTTTRTSTTLSINCGWGNSTVFCACWNSDAGSEELPTSFALSGWAMLDVASQLTHRRFGR